MRKKEQIKKYETLFGKKTVLQQFINKYEKKFNTLTDREVEILTLIAKGINKSAIAERLNISQLAVQNHRLSIQGKLEIESQADFIKYALAFGLVSF